MHITRPHCISLPYFQEKAEEDRYMRQLEAKHYKHQVQQQEQDLGHGKKTAESIEELKLYWERIEPVMNEVRETVLQSTGDVVSDEGLEALARWKLGLM
jgi:hypothetical protein